MEMRKGSRLFLLASVLALLALHPGTQSGAAGVNLSGGTVTAVLVRSWSACPPNPDLTLWDELNSRWSDYGTTPIFIDVNHPQLCPGPITYADLVSTGADVVILSDPAGGREQYTPDEIAALQQYAQDGHRLLGTLLLLQFASFTDNRGLAPLFGLPASASYAWLEFPSSPAYTLLKPGHPLFAGMAGRYDSGGHPSSQTPADYTWDAADLDGAQILAQAEESPAVILAYSAPTYDAIYITSMPELGGNREDERFLNNALTFPHFRQSVFLPLVLRDG